MKENIEDQNINDIDLVEYDTKISSLEEEVERLKDLKKKTKKLNKLEKKQEEMLYELKKHENRKGRKR